MSSVADIAEYFKSLVVKGHGGHPVYLGTRLLDYLCVNGGPMMLEIPHKGNETDGERVFLRAADGE